MLATLIQPLSALASGFDSITVDPLVQLTGLPDDQLRLFVLWILQFPTGYFLHFCVHGAQARHLASTVLGILGMSYFFGTDIQHVLWMSLGSYMLMALAPRDMQQIYVCVYAFAYLSASHINTVIYHFGTYDLEITTNTMLLTLRLIALAFSYQDGGKKPEKLTDRQKLMAVKELPTPLEMASYTFFVQQCALGVFFEFRDLKQWAEESQEYKRVPNPVKPSAKYLGMAFTCLVISVVGTVFFPVANNWDAEFIASNSLAYRMLYTQISIGLKRYFYYTAFLFQTGTVIASGLGYNGKVNEEDQWDKFVGVYVYDSETASNANSFLKAWNHRVHIWMKYYVSERLTGVGGKPKAWHYLVVYCTSAFWHGFYPFFYVAFTMGAMASFAHKDVYGCWYLVRDIPQQVRTGICIFMTQTIVNYTLVLQSALTFEKGLSFLAATYYIGPLSLVFMLIATRAFGLLKMSKSLERKEKARLDQSSNFKDDTKVSADSTKTKTQESSGSNKKTQ